MNKTDLVSEVSKVVSSKKDAQAAVDCVLQSITNALQDGEAVTLIGFGTFKINKREARKGRNPKTGEEITIEAKNVVKFSAGKSLSEAVQ